MGWLWLYAHEWCFLTVREAWHSWYALGACALALSQTSARAHARTHAYVSFALLTPLITLISLTSHSLSIKPA